jgi:hypothetical protein
LGNRVAFRDGPHDLKPASLIRTIVQNALLVLKVEVEAFAPHALSGCVIDEGWPPSGAVRLQPGSDGAILRNVLASLYSPTLGHALADVVAVDRGLARG